MRRELAPRVMNEGGDVGVIEKPFVIDGGLSDEVFEKHLDAPSKVRNEIAAELTARIGEAVGVEPRFRHHQQRDALYARAGNHHRAPTYLAFGVSGSVQIPHPRGTIFIRNDAPTHAAV